MTERLEEVWVSLAPKPNPEAPEWLAAEGKRGKKKGKGEEEEEEDGALGEGHEIDIGQALNDMIIISNTYVLITHRPHHCHEMEIGQAMENVLKLTPRTPQVLAMCVICVPCAPYVTGDGERAEAGGDHGEEGLRRARLRGEHRDHGRGRRRDQGRRHGARVTGTVHTVTVTCGTCGTGVTCGPHG